jgi:hypothetical protein
MFCASRSSGPPRRSLDSTISGIVAHLSGCVRLTTCASAAGDHARARTILRSASSWRDEAGAELGTLPARRLHARVRQRFGYWSRWRPSRSRRHAFARAEESLANAAAHMAR